MRIKGKVLEQIKNDKGLIASLCAELDKSPFTIYRWLRDNHELLTTASALKVITKGLKMSQNQILEEANKAA